MTEPEIDPFADTEPTTLWQRLAWVGAGVILIGGAALLLRRSDDAATKAVPSASVPVEPSVAFTRKQRSDHIAFALFDDTAKALASALQRAEPTEPWSAVLELRSFGPKARPAATSKALEQWQANTEVPEAAIPSVFRAAPRVALASALLEAGHALEPAALDRKVLASLLDGPTSNQRSTSALALQLELSTLLSRPLKGGPAPTAALLTQLTQNTRLANERLDSFLRQPEPLGWDAWQLAAALFHGPPEAAADDQANTRRLWARLAASPLPAELLSEALRCEALSSAVKAGQVSGDEVRATLLAELEHLRYLVNTDVASEALDQQQAQSFALRALRLAKSALATE